MSSTKKLSPKQVEKALDTLLKDTITDKNIDDVKEAEKNTKLLTEKIEKLSI